MKFDKMGLSPLLICAAACGADQASSEDLDDIAVAVAGLTSGEGGEVEAALEAASLAAGRGSLASDGERTYSGDRGELSYAFSIECFDGRDAPLEDCGIRTRRATADMAIDGSVSTERREASLDRAGTWGLEVSPDLSAVTLDGVVDSSVSTSFEALQRDERRSFSMFAEGRYEGVVIDLERGAVVAGRIELSVAADRMRSARFSEVEASFDVEATIEFSPDAAPLLVLDGEQSYELVDERPVSAQSR